MKYFQKIPGLFIAVIIFISCSDPATEAPEPSVFELNTPFYFGDFQVPADNPMKRETVELGRMLFYEKKLSGDNSMSCGSCHFQERAFTDGLRLSPGITGETGTKNTMALHNLLWQERFFWDGRSPDLEQQALDPIENPQEMNESLPNAVRELSETDLYPEKFQAAFGSSEITPERIAKALAQFERTLISRDSKYDRYLRGEYEPTAEEELGIKLFFTHPVAETGLRGANCGDCHTGPLADGAEGFNGFHNNGLDTDQNLKPGLERLTSDPNDRGKFKAPSLRNIALTAPYMHDGRFENLDEVLDHYNDHIQKSATLDPLILEASNEPVIPGEPVKLHLTEEEKQAVKAFLLMLTDETFISDPKFSDPFEK